MHTKTLSEMTAQELMVKVDTLLVYLKSVAGEDSAANWAIASIQEELRRRLFESEARGLAPTPVTVHVERVVFDASDMGRYICKPYEITVMNGGDARMLGFCSAAETDAFLWGLRTAAEFGFPCKGIPDAEDVPEPKDEDPGSLEEAT